MATQQDARHPSDATTATIAATESRKESEATATIQETTSRNSTRQRSSWSPRVVIMTVLVSLGGMIFGYGGIGTIGGFLAMPDYKKRFGRQRADGTWHLGPTRMGTMVGMLMIGALVGSLAAGKIADKFGRKHSISFWSLIYMGGVAVEIASMKAWYQIAIGRTIEGIGIGGLSILVPMYQSECCPKDVRGVVISMYQLFITLGILLASCFNIGTKNIHGSASWRITMAVGIIWPLIWGVGIQLLPESPRWNIRNDKSDQAYETLVTLYNGNGVEAQIEMNEMQVALQVEREQDKITLMGFFREPTILRRFLVGMVLQMMQQLTGINYFFYYGTQLFSDLGVGDGYVTAVILGSVNFVATFAGLWVAKRFGHRIALILGGVWIGVWLLLYAFLGQYCVEATCFIPSKSAGSAMVAFTCLAIVGFATTWGPLAWVVCAEIFPPRWKGAGMGVATATNWTFNFLIGFFTSRITESIGYGLGWVFAGSIIVGAFFVHFFVHETQGKSLEEIDREILAGRKAWNSKSG